MNSEQRCRICGGTARKTGTFELLGHHQVAFFMCESCDFWFTEEPWWLAEAYEVSVNRMDTGSARRSIDVHNRLFPFLSRCFDVKGRYVDWAGGTGLLVRLMRDSGLDFYWQDAYATNTYAGGFEWSPELAPAAAVTAIEVFEHLPDPLTFVAEVLASTKTDTIILSQELHHGPDPDWWYLARPTGQHIAFYTRRTLVALAEKFGMLVRSAGDLHMLTKRGPSETRFRRELRLAPFTLRIERRRLKTLTESDAEIGAQILRDQRRLGQE
jgi:2-polyprenyl-3-methyl-5-hydroxy-6-metoxy-1,4-benzoquinol methylase